MYACGRISFEPILEIGRFNSPNSLVSDNPVYYHHCNNVRDDAEYPPYLS